MMKLSDFYGFKNWFRPEVNEAYRTYSYDIVAISKETEKAVCFECYCSEFSERFYFWAPKSALTTKEELDAIDAKNKKFLDAFENGLEYNKALKDFCIDNGIKVRERNRTETLKNKLKDANLLDAFNEKYNLI